MSLTKVTLVIVVAAAAAGGYWYISHQGAQSDTVGYQTEPASIGRIESIVNTAGTISPVVTVDVGSEISGLVSELDADFNSEVKSGQVIARIDDRTTRARLRQAEADVVSAKASVDQQQANVNRASADLELAQQNVKRQRELSQQKLSSQADVDQAESALKVASAQLEVAKAQVTAAKARAKSTLSGAMAAGCLLLK